MHRVPIWNDGHFLVTNGGDGSIIFWMQLATLKYISKCVWRVNVNMITE